MWWYLLFKLGVIRLFNKSRDLFQLIAGFILSRDTETRLIYNEEMRYKIYTKNDLFLFRFLFPILL